VARQKLCALATSARLLFFPVSRYVGTKTHFKNCPQK
jgi:hypothetical protein